MKIFQKGFHFGQDGPGNRLVYHLQGCNMRCIWCSNPEGMSLEGGKEYSVAELLDECKRSRPMFFSDGGVTFTGGEATVQHGELLKLLTLLGNEGIHRAIETNGSSPRLCDLTGEIDYLIMDFKHHDGETLKRYTGIGNDVLKSNFESICASGRQLHIRIPLINGFNADSPEKFAEYFSRSDTSNAVFEFLPYHEYGKSKWQSEYKMRDGFIDEAILSRFEEEFSRHGLTVVKT